MIGKYLFNDTYEFCKENNRIEEKGIDITWKNFDK